MKKSVSFLTVSTSKSSCFILLVLSQNILQDTMDGTLTCLHQPEASDVVKRKGGQNDLVDR